MSLGVQQSLERFTASSILTPTTAHPHVSLSKVLQKETVCLPSRAPLLASTELPDTSATGPVQVPPYCIWIASSR